MGRGSTKRHRADLQLEMGDAKAERWFQKKWSNTELLVILACCEFIKEPIKFIGQLTTLEWQKEGIVGGKWKFKAFSLKQPFLRYHKNRLWQLLRLNKPLYIGWLYSWIKEIGVLYTWKSGFSTGKWSEGDINPAEECIGTAEEYTGAAEEHYVAVEEYYAAVEEHYGTAEEHYVALEEYYVALEEYYVAVEEHYAAVEEHYVAAEEDYAAVEEHYVAVPVDYGAGNIYSIKWRSRI